MEDSYAVHRRRKAAARKREKTPEPPERFNEIENEDEDDDEKRARMERMVETSEKMEEMRHKQQLHGYPDQEVEQTIREKSPRRSKIQHQDDNDVKCQLETKTTATTTPSTYEEDSAKNNELAREFDETAQQATAIVIVPPKTEDVEDKNINIKKKGDSQKSNEDEESARDLERVVKLKKRSRDRSEKQSYVTDSSDGEDKAVKARKTKTPEICKPKTRHLSPSPNVDVEYESSKNAHKSRKRASTRQKYSASDEESSPNPAAKRSDNFPCGPPVKQIIPLNDSSLMKDLSRAQPAYFMGDSYAYDTNYDDDYYLTGVDEVRERRRKKSVSHTDSEKDTVAKSVSAKTRRSWWLSWIPFPGSKQEQSSDEPEDADFDQSVVSEKKKLIAANEKTSATSNRVSIREFFSIIRNIVSEFSEFKRQNPREVEILCNLRNLCFAEFIIMMIFSGLGGFMFRFTEGAFESFYKCGVKRVKRDFLDSLWNYSHNMREDDWKSMARRKLMEFEEQLHEAHEAGVQTYSGQKSWSFLNAVVYCLTIITTIGYGHISPSTTTGRALTIVYAIFGIPMFLIILADFGKLFTRGMKFLWAFVRRLYYTGSCRKVRRTVPVQEVMKGVQLVYDLAMFRRPSQMNPEEFEEIQKRQQKQQQQQQQQQQQTVLNLDGTMIQQPDSPATPAMSTFSIDDEFNLPISVAISILLGYIFIGATLYYMWEDWGFFESFYFVFISMSTIGFGDYVPKHPIYMMCSIVYLVFGLALTSMCINVVQVMLSDQFKQASQKIGATIGFEVQEEDGSIKPLAPEVVEIADVHTVVKESDNDRKISPKVRLDDTTDSKKSK